MTPPRTSMLPEGYANWLTQLESYVTQASQGVALFNTELVQLYNRLSDKIRNRQKAQGCCLITLVPCSDPVDQTRHTAERECYAQQNVVHDLSTSPLELNIMSRLQRRQLDTGVSCDD